METFRSVNIGQGMLKARKRRDAGAFGRTGRMWFHPARGVRGRDRGQENRRSDQSFSETLDAESRKIFVRRYFWAEPVKELAGNLNISEGKVKSQLFRMRAKLKMHPGKGGDGTVKRMKSFSTLWDQIDERPYCGGAGISMHQKAQGLRMKIKQRCPKGKKLFFTDSGDSGAAAARYLHWSSRNCTVAAAFGRTRTGDGGL